jgi:hypothetical protein
MQQQLSGPACHVELNINIFAGQYLISLQVDGMIQKRLVLQTAREVADWTDTILCIAGQDLYIHVRPQGTRQNQVALELAGKLSRQDLMIGITEQPAICGIKSPRLQ